MNNYAVRVERLSKRYRIAAPGARYRTMRDALVNAAAAPFRAMGAWGRNGSGRPPSEHAFFWALNDLSFDINQGEVLGVIGRNGAGKSTLLKVLARITEPTTGHAEIRGRIASLLEVGTGFHPELSGRENIYLNGAILGMRRDEIDRKLEEIVAFAEVSRFVDTPVKHYSSGMYLRLAFSVAAHLEPDILLVDEVLAVGDMAFQRKCLGKMENVAACGRTVLFVSHNLAAIRQLCQTSIVIDQGRLVFKGPVAEGLGRYSRMVTEDEIPASTGRTRWWGLGIRDCAPTGAASLESQHGFAVEASLDLADEFSNARLFCLVHDSFGNLVVHNRIQAHQVGAVPLPTGRHRLRVEFPALWLAPGLYTLSFKLLGVKACGSEERHVSERLMLDVVSHVEGIGRAHLAPPVRWTVSPADAVGCRTEGSGLS
jgi:lipopolysaccharide transport system ATP-binding protein